MPASFSSRFLETTRGRIVTLLRSGAQTVDALAQALGLTDNAVRAHLSSLERDGLVRQDGVRRSPGAGKPATLYEFDPAAEPLFSRAYEPVLGAMLDELADVLSAEQREALMLAVGRRLAAQVVKAPVGGDLESRATAAAELLNGLGGTAQVERHDSGLVIRGCGGCPLSAATVHHPMLCRAVETLLGEVIGAPVREACDREERPRCQFEILEAA